MFLPNVWPFGVQKGHECVRACMPAHVCFVCARVCARVPVRACVRTGVLSLSKKVILVWFDYGVQNRSVASQSFFYFSSLKETSAYQIF